MEHTPQLRTGESSHAAPREAPTFNNLAERHLRELRDESAIPDEVIAEQGYRTVTDPVVLLKLGFDDYQCRMPGIL